jgi:hypothetical protein
MNNFRTIDRETGFLLPPSVDEWLPEKHLARFVVEVIDGMDLRAMSGSYRGSRRGESHPGRCPQDVFMGGIARHHRSVTLRQHPAADSRKFARPRFVG